MNSLVGYTGFVGQNIAKSCQFDGLYNSQNIREAFATNPDVLVYAGVKAEMFLANNYPEQDLELMNEAIDNIKKINPKHLVLISTISVYGELVSGDETTVIEPERLTAYGRNRLYLENWVESNVENHLIVRLPALYGEGIKKNFIYDYIHVIPALLKYEKYEQLLQDNKSLGEYYEKQDNGFYRCRALKTDERRMLINYFKTCGFSALNFTDSRSKYQFYNLKYLWEHIKVAMNHGISKVNLVTEPIEVAELFQYLEEKEFDNEVMKIPFDYNLRTLSAGLYEGTDGYIFDKDFVKQDIKKFVETMKKMEGLA